VEEIYFLVKLVIECDDSIKEILIPSTAPVAVSSSVYLKILSRVSLLIFISLFLFHTKELHSLS